MHGEKKERRKQKERTNKHTHIADVTTNVS